MATKSKKKTKSKKQPANKKTAAKKKPAVKSKAKVKVKAKAKTKAKVTTKAKAKTTAKAKPKAKSKATSKKAAPKAKSKVAAPKKKEKKLSAAQLRKQQAEEAILAAMTATENSQQQSETEEEEFDPAAFYAASGVDPSEVRPHVMRKERVDVQLFIRFRMPKSPLVHNAELINLSKGGLCIQTSEEVKNGTPLRIEIPLPHTSELFAVQAEVMWSHQQESGKYEGQFHTGLRFLPMSTTKQSVINTFIQQRRDEIIMAKIGLDRFGDSAPVAGVE